MYHWATILPLDDRLVIGVGYGGWIGELLDWRALGLDVRYGWLLVDELIKPSFVSQIELTVTTQRTRNIKSSDSRQYRNDGDVEPRVIILELIISQRSNS